MEQSIINAIMITTSVAITIMSILSLIHHGVMYFLGRKIKTNVIVTLLFCFVLGVLLMCITSEQINNVKRRVNFENALEGLEGRG